MIGSFIIGTIGYGAALFCLSLSIVGFWATVEEYRDSPHLGRNAMVVVLALLGAAFGLAILTREILS